MKIALSLLSVFGFTVCPFFLCEGGIVESQLAPYESFLKNGTYAGYDFSRVLKIPKSRYDTFKTAFEFLESMDNPVVVELGTTRSFTHGGLPGCNSNDVSYWKFENPEGWDWGAGFFTRMAPVALGHANINMHTVDLCSDHIKRCQVMTSDFADIIQYHISDSVAFLRNCNFPEGIHLLYLDTGDMIPDTQLLQLEEAKVVVERNLIADGGLILLDDVRNQMMEDYHGDTSGLGKSKYALPFLLDNGFDLIMDEYQVLLQKRGK